MRHLRLHGLRHSGVADHHFGRLRQALCRVCARGCAVARGRGTRTPGMLEGVDGLACARLWGTVLRYGHGARPPADRLRIGPRSAPPRSACGDRRATIAPGRENGRMTVYEGMGGRLLCVWRGCGVAGVLAARPGAPAPPSPRGRAGGRGRPHGSPQPRKPATASRRQLWSHFAGGSELGEHA
jgi:hypothetical protein